MTSPTPTLDAMPEARRSLLSELKRRGGATIAELAPGLGVSYEAARQQIGQLEHEGWVSRQVLRDAAKRGRPSARYQLTAAGEHLFPKDYPDLAVALIDAAADRLGPAAVKELLAEVARRKIEAWQPRLDGKSLPERLDALREVYAKDDPYCVVEEGAEGEGPRLIEVNCPYRDVALRRPALCSVTVSVLRSLLGREVRRTERLQHGNGRCVFQVGQIVAPNAAKAFDWEPEPI
jgi:DeoR family suf operon transcriptional repressor